MGLVNSTNHSLVIFVEEMKTSEQFSKFAEAWKTHAKRQRSGSLLSEKILCGTEEIFLFVEKNIPKDPSVLISQLGWDSAKEGHVVCAL